MKPPGYNPLRWDCDERGCFNSKKRPKIEQFADCFPGRINFGDVDARVEINGHFLELEWKPAPGPISVGQTRAFIALTRSAPFIVYVVAGDAETMEVEAVAYFWRGKFHAWEEMGLDGLKDRIRKWAAWAQTVSAA